MLALRNVPEYCDAVTAAASHCLPLLKLRGKSILVTGASGLIGSAVVDLLLALNDNCSFGMSITVAGRSVDKLRERFGEREDLAFLPYDATRSNKIECHFDLMVLAASPASPNLFRERPLDVIRANAFAVDELLDLACKTGTKKVVYVSSSEVYGVMVPPEQGFQEDHYGEVDITNPRNSYAEGKRVAETICASYAAQYNLDVSIVRPGHVYGPTALISDKRVSSCWAYDVASGKDIVMKSDGAQVRSYVHCLDCASAILFVLGNGVMGCPYNIANRAAVISIRRLAELLCEIGGTKLLMDIPSEAERKSFNPMLNSSLDASRLESLGWMPMFGAREGLTNTVTTLRKVVANGI